jgi:integrase
MRKRHQEGSVKKQRGLWIAQRWEEGHRRNRTIGRVSQMTKAEARAELVTIITPINIRQSSASVRITLGEFVKYVFYPFYRRKWKPSTAQSNEQRVNYHLVPEFGERALGSFSRDELQSLLERKSAKGLSYSVVSHLRWDLKQIFDLAVAEDFALRNPATLLFTPREARKPSRLVMNLEEVKKVLSVLECRERLVVKLAILSGMRPGEIFGLRWERLQGRYAEIRQRVYRGKVDTPKTTNSIRMVALTEGLLTDIEEWRGFALDGNPDAWVFPSEALSTPLSKDNCWRRRIGPKLKEAGLGWVTFQVMRRTHSSLMNDLKVDPKIVADQLGHTLNVNQNIYTQSAMERRKEAVDSLESALLNA